MNDTTNTKHGGGRKRALIIGASILAVTLAAAGAGIGIHAHRTGMAQAEAQDARQTAYTACQQASDGAKASLDAYQKAVTDTQTTVQTDPATLADPATLDTLKTAQANATVTPGACDTSMDTGALDALTQAWKDAGSAWDKATGDVTAAAKAVTDSQTKKTLDDANKALDQQLADGHALLESSDGQVADAQTRFDLTDALNQGQALRDANSTDVNAINAAAGAIYNASVNVNQSIAKKQADDAAAAQAAAQAQAEAQAQAQRQAQAQSQSRASTGTTRSTTPSTTRSATSGSTRTTTRATSGGTTGTTPGTTSSGSPSHSNTRNAQPDESFFSGFGGGCELSGSCDEARAAYDGYNHNTY